MTWLDCETAIDGGAKIVTKLESVRSIRNVLMVEKLQRQVDHEWS